MLDIRLVSLIHYEARLQAIADGMQAQLREATLRAEMLTIELSEVRATLAERDSPNAQLISERNTLRDQCVTCKARRRCGGSCYKSALLQGHACCRARRREKARDRYEGLSQRLLLETSQQRQALQDEITRLVSQLKFAENVTLPWKRVTHLDTALTDMHTAKETRTEKSARSLCQHIPEDATRRLRTRPVQPTHSPIAETATREESSRHKCAHAPHHDRPASNEFRRRRRAVAVRTVRHG